MPDLRVFVAGATGVMGTRLVPLLVDAGYTVAGMTRTGAKMKRLVQQGATPVLVDVFERDPLIEAVRSFDPDVILHQLTDLPDDAGLISELAGLNARMRREGTDNLLAAAAQSGTTRFLAQSVAFPLDGVGGEAVAYHEQAVLGFGGTVLRYGQWYGAGTFHETQPPPPPRIHIDEAARRTVAAVDAGPGILELTETPGGGS